MAHALRSSLLLLPMLLVGCYDSHGRTPVVGIVDAAVVVSDVPSPPDLRDAPECHDCSCCTCGRPSEGVICPLIGLDECCLGPSVEASIASVTLGEDCPAEDGDRDDGSFEDCALDGCGCLETALQLRLRAIVAAAPESTIAVREVRLLRDGVVVATLVPGAMLVWSAADGAYVPWDGTLATAEEQAVRVPTSSPDWTALGDGDPWRTYGMVFRVEVTVEIDGALRDLALEPVVRESEITT